MATFKQKYGDKLLGIALLIGVFEILIPLVTGLLLGEIFFLFAYVGLADMQRASLMMVSWLIILWFNWDRISKMFGKRKF